MEFIPRHIQWPRQSFFLFGPRGTGKSQWLKHIQESSPHASALIVNMLDPEAYRLYQSHPELLREKILASSSTKRVVIDEVQKVPEILTVVHELIEMKKGIQFILTGSSARKLKRTGVDLLAGRAIVLSMHPFMASELGKNFHLNEALKFGMLPIVWGAEEKQKTLQAYIGIYLREEVQMEAMVRNIGNFSRFLESISFSQGSILNISNVSRDCGVERKTIEGFLQVLEDLLLCHRLPIFTKKAKRETVQHPKFYYFDAGVFRSLRPSGPLDQPSEIEGAVLETLVFQHLLAWNAYRGNLNKLYYWRTRADTEVDFILYGEDGIWAFEVKNSKKIRPEDLSALNTFIEDYPQARAFFLYRGQERLKKGKILCLPCEEFLKNLSPTSLPFD